MADYAGRLTAPAFDPDKVASQHPGALSVAAKAVDGLRRWMGDLEAGRTTLDDLDNDKTFKQYFSQVAAGFDRLAPGERGIAISLLDSVANNMGDLALAAPPRSHTTREGSTKTDRTLIQTSTETAETHTVGDHTVETVRNRATGLVLHEEWNKGDGESLDREDGPAVTDRHPGTGIIVFEGWRKYGVPHRPDGGPANIWRDGTSGRVTAQEWWQGGELARRVQYNSDGSAFETDGAAHSSIAAAPMGLTKRSAPRGP